MPGEQSKARDRERCRADLLLAVLRCAEHMMARGNLCRVTGKRHISECSHILWCNYWSLYIHFSKALVLIVDTESEASSPRASACAASPCKI